MEPRQDRDDADGAALPLHHLRQADDAVVSPEAPRSTAFLDGLRGLAALCVYIYHHAGWFYGPKDDIFYGLGHNGNYYLIQIPWLRFFITGGPGSVAIFFVLSGYVLSVSAWRVLASGNIQKCRSNLIAAVVRRPFRLYLPTLAVALAFAVALQLPAPLAPRLVWPASEPSILLELRRLVVSSLHMMNPFEEHTITSTWYPYVPPAYTMAVEFEGSMVLFAALAGASFLPSRARPIAFALAAVVFWLAYRWALACFMAGALLALYDVDPKLPIPFTLPTDRARNIFTHAMLAAGWFLLCEPSVQEGPKISAETPGFGLLTRLIPPYYQSHEYWRFWHSAGAAMVLYAVLRLRWLQAFFKSKPLQYLGRVSFALYLVHVPLEWTISDAVYRVFGSIRSPEQVWFADGLLPIPDFGIRGLTTRFLVSQLVILPFNLAVAELATNLLDAPSIAAGKWVVARLGLGNRSGSK